MRFAILQTCIPHYRIGLFEMISSKLGPEFGVLAGDSFYDPSLVTAARGKSWYYPCSNHFLAGRKFLVQSGIGSLSRTQALVVEANPRSLSTWKLLYAARNLGIRTAAWGHALGRGAKSIAGARRAMFSLADEIICYGHNEQAPLQRLFPRKKIRVAGNTVLHAEDCSPLPTPVSERNVALLLGRLIPAKKGMLFLEAIRLLQNRGDSIGAVIIGDGPERQVMEELAATAGLKDIEFTGEISELKSIRQYASKAFCMVSAGYAGLSLLHAQSMGLPFLYSQDEPNAPEIEIARDGWNCHTFKSNDANDLAMGILSMHMDARKWLAKSETFCDGVRQSYSIESMADQFVDFFLS
jgi:glycosyltransferase involved in cell wall biosynthesis